ncbi:MAG: hypothetical protein M1829_004950 [Trizodia sp. TS-e1964]|nr:MAG: hypothetical protein M1829_004950 [Trizodia sp. TS-e1964]
MPIALPPSLFLFALLPLIAASPTPIPTSAAPTPAANIDARITPAPLAPRALVSDIKSLAGEIGSVLGSLGSNIPSYVASGVPNFFQDFPDGNGVRSTLGLDDSQIAALPTKALNLPPYGNWTDKGWNVRFHGNIYKQPNIPQSKLDDLANGFLIGTSVDKLSPDEAKQARNLTAEIYVIQQGKQNVTLNLVPTNGSMAQSQAINFPYLTTPEGDFDEFVPLANSGGSGLMPGNTTSKVQTLNSYVQGSDTGNATAYLVPTTGLTIISDIDDILRITKIYKPSEGLLNSFARAFTPWMNMPSIYSNWSQALPDAHFHYLTTTPEQITPNYMSFIFNTYPLGSFDTRPLNFSDVAATLSIRKFLLTKIFQTYPQRKFVLVADTSNSDVMRDYPAMVTDFPNQVQCIFLRNTSATDSDDRFPYDTSGFKNLNQSQYMFFTVPDDLHGLDIARGQCYNTSVAQNLTFSYQGLPFGFGSTPVVNGSANGTKPSAAAPRALGPWSDVWLRVVGAGLLAVVVSSGLAGL